MSTNDERTKKGMESRGATQTGTKTILEYFEEVDPDAGRDKMLFDADEDDIDLKTEVDEIDIVHFSTMRANDDFLQKAGVGAVYAPFINAILRLRISKGRQSRGEFVDMNRHHRYDALANESKASLQGDK